MAQVSPYTQRMALIMVALKAIIVAADQSHTTKQDVRILVHDLMKTIEQQRK